MIDSSFQNMSSFAGTTAVNAAIGESARYAASQSVRATRHVSPIRPVRLEFRPSPEVRNQNNARILAAFSQTSPTVDTSSLRLALNRGQLQAVFAQLLGTAGLSSSDLADVLTGYLIISWEVVSGEDSRAHAAGYPIVRSRLRESLGSDPRVAKMSDADKQQFAETLEVLAMLAVAARDGLKTNGKPEQLAALQEGVRRTGQKLGVDFATIAFTEAGFQSR